MIIETTRFGGLEAAEEELITFPRGLVGLPELTGFFMFDGPAGTPFKWLQSTDRAELAYVVCDPVLFVPDYRVRASVEELAPVEITAVDDAVVAVVLSVPDDWRLMTANLAGPLVFNVPKRLGMQLVVSDPAFSVKHCVFGGPGGPAAAEAPGGGA